MKSLAKNTTFNVFYNVINIIFPLITVMYVSRILLDDGTGVVSYAQNLASYFVTFAGLGISTHGVREIAKVSSDKIASNKIFSELFLINLLTTILSTALYFILIFCIPDFRNDYLLFLSCGIQIAMNALNVDWLYKGKEEYSFIFIRSLFVKILSLIAVFLFVKSRNDYIIYALISSLSLSLNYVFNVIHARKFVSLTFANLEFKRHIRPLLILGLSIFLSTIYSKIDITMMGSMSTDSAIGLYSNAHKIVEIIKTITVSISTVFLPRLSLFYSKNKDKFYELISFGTKIISLFAFPMTIGAFVLAPQIIIVMFGDSFSPAIVTMRIFSLLIIIKSFGDLLCYQLVIATGNEFKSLPAYIIATTANIILNLILIPYLAQNGACIASVVTELIVCGIQFFSMKKFLKFKMPIICILKDIVSSIVMGLSIFLILNFTKISYTLLQLFLGFIIGCFVYLIMCLLLKNELVYVFIKRIRNRKRK